MFKTQVSSSLDDNKDNKEYNNENEEIDEKNLSKIVMDTSLPIETLIKALNMYYKQNSDDVAETINRITMMYEITGVKTLKKYIYAICTDSDINFILKCTCALSLCSKDEKDSAGYKAILNIFPKLNDDVSTPYKIELIKLLMKRQEYKKEARDFFCEIISSEKLDSRYRYKTILSLETNSEFIYFLTESAFEFLKNEKNEIQYRILAGQLLFQKKEHITQEMLLCVENILLSIGKNENIQYNTRADAIDILLQSSNTNMKNEAKTLIMELGKQGKTVRTLYENAQNVHTKEIENSVKNALEFLQTFEIMKINNNDIDLTYIEKEISKIADEKEIEIIKISLNRISLDRALYGNYNNTLEHIILRIYTYMSDHEHETELLKRMKEELIEMAGTCSSGFASRLINIISGFGDFSLRISWADQIASNFMGRLNAKIRDMDDLKLQEKVLTEMTLPSSEYNKRQHFLQFLRENVSYIREELYEEFKDHISDTDFDLWFKSAVLKYEVEN